MNQGPAALSTNALDCGYRGHLVLAGVELRFRRGESVALLGKNGSGKSTLLKTLAGDLAPIAGTVEMEGEPLGGLSPVEIAKRISVVPQEETHPFAFSVLEVVTMGRLARSGSIFDSQDDLKAAREAMARVECGHLANRPITELSGGEKQRVLMARALAQETPVVLLDEPASHLDPPHQLSMAEFIADLAGQGKCAVTAIHDLNSVSALAARCVLIADGKIIADGDTEAVLQSEALEDCYQASFERVRSQSGRLVVIPGRSREAHPMA